MIMTEYIKEMIYCEPESAARLVREDIINKE